MKPSQILAIIACVACSTAVAGEPPPLAKAPFDAEQAGRFQQQWATHIGRPVVHTNSIGMKLTLIPPGEFQMGVSEKETYEKLRRNMLKSSSVLERNLARDGGLLVEMPAHRVRLTKPFYMGSFEVTVGQFRRFAEETGYKTDAGRGLVYGKPFKGKKPIRTWRTPLYPDRPPDQQQPRDNDPVMHIDWNDCMAFCKWLSKKEVKEGYKYSLPTSAEWEFACRAGTTTLWYFGDEDAFKKFRHEYEYISWNGKSPRAVGQGKPNPFGLYDMHGNMMEWCADWLHERYYLESPLNDPTGPLNMNEERNRRRMVRGGAFEVGRYWSRSAWYVRIAQGSNQHRHPGFRVAMHIKGVRGVPPAPEPHMRIVGKDKTPADPIAAQNAAVRKGRPKELTIKLNENVSMELVLVPAGSFLMGSRKGGRYERPVHPVTISRLFYIGKYEVTQRQYDAVMGAKDRVERWGKYSPVRYRPRLVGPEKPMHYLSWNDWQEFLKTLNKKVAVSLRETKPHHAERDDYFALPTEAQWEYACRAGSTTEYSFGDDPSLLREYASFCADDALHWGDRNVPDFTVGRRKPNAWGIHDMHGNAQEWCADWWDKDYYSKSSLVDPQGPEEGHFKVLRGGSIRNYSRYARSAFRFRMLPGLRDTANFHTSGARLVINLSSDTEVSSIPAGTPPTAVAPLGAAPAQRIQKQWAKHLGEKVVFTNSVGMKMVLIPPGEFTMGTTAAEREKMLAKFRSNPIFGWFRGNSAGEVPAHRVRITKPFYLATTEVTVEQFRRFVEATGYKTDVERSETLGGRKGGFAFVPDDPASKKWYGWLRKPGYTWRNVGYKQPASQPVFNVSWNDATEFCRWLSKKDGARYRLPTEAEWEYACRAGSTTWWSFGNDSAKFGDYGWHEGNSKNKPQPVGTKKPNAWGIYDMQGNLFEWCADWKDAEYYKRSPVEDPQGPSASPGKTRVLRGGSFDGDRLINRPAFRVQANQRIGFFHIGFRVVMETKTKSEETNQ